MGVCDTKKTDSGKSIVNNNFAEINNDEIKCKYDQEELNRKLNNFINQINIQDLSKDQKDYSDDSVYQLIKRDENEELTKFFKEKKETFIKDIDYYLSPQNMNNNLYPLVSQIISNENGEEIYKNKIKKQISKIKEDEKSININHLTILLTGKSGTGKSTLINVLLKLKGKEKAATGVGTFITTKTTAYKSKNIPYLRLIDTRGIELNVEYGPKEVKTECIRFIKSQISTNDINNFVHCIWYCIAGVRLEESEINLLNSLRNSYSNTKIPIILVYMQNTDDGAMGEMKHFIKVQNIEGDFIDILAKEKIIKGIKIPGFGLEKLVAKTIKKVREALNGDLRNVMINNISNQIENYLIEENRKLKNKINEDTILTLIEQGKVQNENDLENTLINAYGINVNYFFKNQYPNKNTILAFKNSNLIKNKNNYFKYTQRYEENIIKNELSDLAYKFLDIQAKKEKFRGKSTLPKNKRCHEDFINTNKSFLLKNLDYIAQKHYYNFIITKSCIQLTEAFEYNLNNITHNLLNNEEIKSSINKCFLDKYEQFEGRIKDYDSKINFEPAQNDQDDDTYLVSNFSKQGSKIGSKFDFKESEFGNQMKDLQSFTTKYE